MAAQLAFAAVISGREAALARAVVGVPGLLIDRGFGTFSTWTQANECARRLNESLGLSRSDSWSIVVDAMLSARKLIAECGVLRREAKEIRERLRCSPALCKFVLTQLELGITLCETACTCSPTLDQGDRLLRGSSRALTSARLALGNFAFEGDMAREIAEAIQRLEAAVEKFAPKVM